MPNFALVRSMAFDMHTISIHQGGVASKRVFKSRAGGTLLRHLLLCLCIPQ
jgi:hypothetical protein